MSMLATPWDAIPLAAPAPVGDLGPFLATGTGPSDGAFDLATPWTDDDVALPMQATAMPDVLLPELPTPREVPAVESGVLA